MQMLTVTAALLPRGAPTEPRTVLPLVLQRIMAFVKTLNLTELSLI